MNNLRPSSVASCLFTKSQQQILGLLFNYSDRSFYQNEIIRFASMGKGVVLRELEKLQLAGIIRRESVGNQRHYSANPKCIVFRELQSIISKTLAREELIRLAVNSLSAYLDQAFIYGEFANGKEEQNSEIGMILVSDRLTTGSAVRAFAPVEKSIGVKIKHTILTRKQYAERITRKNSFIAGVMEQPKLWLINRPSEERSHEEV